MNGKKITLELVWWVFTAAVLTLVMFPIWKDFPSFKFNATNIGYIVAFITFSRYTFLLEYTWLAGLEKVKIIFILLTLAFIGLCLTEMQDFNVWYDAGDPDQLLASVRSSQRESLLTYIRTEFLFFAVAAMISSVFLAGRLMVSIWTVRNRGRV
jgi:hypothetical protein